MSLRHTLPRISAFDARYRGLGDAIDARESALRPLVCPNHEDVRGPEFGARHSLATGGIVLSYEPPFCPASGRFFASRGI